MPTGCSSADNVGEGEPRQIVCGAWNFGAGATVAVALPGCGAAGRPAPRARQAPRRHVRRGMILSEQGARARHRPQRHHGARRGRARRAARRRAAAGRGDPRGRADGEPGRPAVRLRRRARGGGSASGVELAPPARPSTREPARGRRAVDITHRGHRALPHYGAAMVVDVQIGPSPLWLRVPAGWEPAGAVDLQRRRHHQPGDAGGPPHARLRLRPGARRQDRGAPRGRGREAPDARRRRSHPGGRRPRHRRRRRADRAGGDHGRRGDGGRATSSNRRSCSRRRTSSPSRAAARARSG